MKSSLVLVAMMAVLTFSCGRRDAQPGPSDMHQPQVIPSSHEPNMQHETPAEPVGHRFEKAEDWTQVFENPERDAWQKPSEVIASMELKEGQAVADIGAGTGYFLPHLARAVGSQGKVYAVDIEEDMVRHLKKRAEKQEFSNVLVRKADPTNTGLEPSSVDRILMVNTWHHVPERASYAALLTNNLRPKGRIYIVDYTMESPRGPSLDHRISPEKVAQELKQAGLEAVILQETLPYQYIVMGEKN